MSIPKFTTNTVYTNTDKSTLTSLQRQLFDSKHSNLLNQKHQSTIKHIKDLQELEKYMFNNLQSLNKSDPNAIEETEVIKARINELKNMRMTLFRQLKNMYIDTQKMTSDNRSNLADQITMTKVVENELNNAKKQLELLKQDKLNKKRLVELGEYEYDRYTSHRNLLKVIAYGGLAILFFTILLGQPWFPSILGFGAITIIAVIIIITIAGRVFANWYRDNLYWDKFRWKTCSKKDEYGQCIDINKDRKGLDWFKLFSNTCVNFADYAKTTKDTLLNRTAKIKAKFSDDKVVMGESFTNMVNPSQPEGFESFHNIF